MGETYDAQSVSLRFELRAKTIEPIAKIILNHLQEDARASSPVKHVPTKQLRCVTRHSGGSTYLHYGDTPVAETVSLNEAGSVVIDFDADGEVVGIKVVDAGGQTAELLRQIALDHNLLLEGFPPIE